MIRKAVPVRAAMTAALTKLTASLFRNCRPEILTMPFPGLFDIFMVSSSTPENCRVAPRRESTREPTRPARQHRRIAMGAAVAEGSLEMSEAK